MRFLFEPLAKTEFFEAIAWYEKEQPGLGRQFSQEVIKAVSRAKEQPELFAKSRGRARKIRLRRFKAYSIFFAIKDDCFSVVAVFHGARNPRDLLKRLR